VKNVPRDNSNIVFSYGNAPTLNGLEPDRRYLMDSVLALRQNDTRLPPCVTELHVLQPLTIYAARRSVPPRRLNTFHYRTIIGMY